jgi:hypothetical protein
MDDDDTVKRPSEITGSPPPPPKRPNVGSLEYRADDTPEPFTPRRIPQEIPFWIAFLGGIGLSSFAWFSGDQPGVHTNSDLWITSMLFVKIIGGVTLICFRRSRTFGIGLLCSLLVGCLIFGYSSLAQCAHSLGGK